MIMREHSIYCPVCGSEVVRMTINPGKIPMYKIKYKNIKAVPDEHGAIVSIVCSGCKRDVIEIISSKD